MLPNPVPLCAAVAALSALLAVPQEPAAPRVIKPNRVSTYKKTPEGELKLHVFAPERKADAEPAPAIVFFFGGGWKSGHPRQFYEQAQFFAEHGFVAISAEYRIKNTHGTSPFECVEDGKSAVRWVRAHAEEMGVDPTKIVSAGGSAGGHVAACTGVIEGFDCDTEDAEISSVPNAMILFNPVLDTTKNGFEIGPVGRERRNAVSPSEHVRKGCAPTLIFHGTSDKTVPFAHAERFNERMKDAGNACRLEAFEDAPHGFFNGTYFRKKGNDGGAYERTMRQSLEFLKALGLMPKQSASTEDSGPPVDLRHGPQAAAKHTIKRL